MTLNFILILIALIILSGIIFWLCYKPVKENHIMIVERRFFPGVENGKYHAGGRVFVNPFLNRSRQVLLKTLQFDNTENYITSDYLKIRLSKVIGIAIDLNPDVLPNYEFIKDLSDEAEMKKSLYEILEDGFSKIIANKTKLEIDNINRSNDYDEMYRILNQEFNKIGLTVVSIRIRK